MNNNKVIKNKIENNKLTLNFNNNYIKSKMKINLKIAAALAKS